MPSKNISVLALVVSICVLVIVSVTQIHATTIVICDVGQGDAIYIRTHGVDVVVDAGQTNAVLSCLGRHMPFYDHTIDVIVISHPQFDHYGGFLPLLDRYHVQTAVLPPVVNENKSYPLLLAKLRKKKIRSKVLYSGDKIALSDSSFSFIWPTKEYARLHSIPEHAYASAGVLGTSTEDFNNFSSLILFSLGDFDLLLTGDASPNVLFNTIHNPLLDESIEVLKVPHHGSRNGLTKEFLEKVSPKLAVISAGRNNRFGHPHQSVLDLLKKNNTPYKITAKEGDIVIEVSDFGWKLKN